jgi:hypothetical protein
MHSSLDEHLYEINYIAIYQGVNVIKRQVVSKVDEILEAASLGGANDDDIHHFISNLFRSNRTQTFLNCQTVDI